MPNFNAGFATGFYAGYRLRRSEMNDYLDKKAGKEH